MTLSSRLEQLERSVASLPPRPRDPEEVRADMRAVMIERAKQVEALAGARAADPATAHLDMWSGLFAEADAEQQERMLDAFMMIGGEEWLQALTDTAPPRSGRQRPQEAL